MTTPTATLLKHVLAFRDLARRAEGDTKQRVLARYEEAKKALKAQREKEEGQSRR